VSGRKWVGAIALGTAALAMSSGTAHAQTGKISGVATDAATGQPIEGVQVQVQGTRLGAATQANGRFFIISVPPGTYTVVARRIGFQSVELANVTVRIDVTREANFRMNTAATTIAAVQIVAEAAPLVEQGVTGGQVAVAADVIAALPVTDVAGVLALQQGFLAVPDQNTDIVSFSDSRRSVNSPIRIRGGRGNETLTLLDGFPIPNPVFGGASFDVNNLSIQQIDYQKGGFEPQYGNAQSGIINLATREGGTRLGGAFEYQGSGIGPNIGATQDKLLGLSLFRGYLSGPIPGTNNTLRFLVSGQQQQSADQVQKYDNDVNDFSNFFQGNRFNAPSALDLFSGFRAFGYNSQRDFLGKLTWLPTSTTRINLLAVDYSRQRQRADFDFNFTGFNVLNAPGIQDRVDSILVGAFSAFENTVQGSINVERRFAGATVEQRFGRSNLVLRAGYLDQERETCNFFQGICLGDRFADTNFSDQFVTPNRTAFQVTGTDTFFGGERVKSPIFRADFQSQVTDHHNLQLGAFYTKHDIVFSEVRNLGTNSENAVPQRYAAKPYEFATYFQDRIEYDFLTVKLGARFDYARASGSSYTNPQDPTNGTTRTSVCNGLAPQLGGGTVFTTVDSAGNTISGEAACSSVKLLGDSARLIAQRDDFRKADPRRAFAPRIGVNFPLTERSGLFFNFGRYNQNPVYNSLYQNTGVGTVDGPDGGNVCKAGNVKPGTRECFPIIVADAYTPPYVGNANLKIEQTTSYELGYAAEVGTGYAINVTLFTKDQTGLTGIRRSAAKFDAGVTYGSSLPRYNVIVNQDYTTSKGLEFQFRRRVRNYMGFDINYSFSSTTTNAAPPDLQQEALNQGDSTSLREITSEVDQPHAFNASLLLRVDNRAPQIRFGNLLRNTYATLTTQARSGFPYTPTTTFGGFGDQGQQERNSGRGPATFQTDILAGKDLNFGGIKYGAFVRIQNLLDRENCIQVFTSTGRCDSGTIDQDRSRNGNSVGENAPSTFFNRGAYFGARRSVYTGLRVNF